MYLNNICHVNVEIIDNNIICVLKYCYVCYYS